MIVKTSFELLIWCPTEERTFVNGCNFYFVCNEFGLAFTGQGTTDDIYTYLFISKFPLKIVSGWKQSGETVFSKAVTPIFYIHWCTYIHVYYIFYIYIYIYIYIWYMQICIYRWYASTPMLVIRGRGNKIKHTGKS